VGWGGDGRVGRVDCCQGLRGDGLGDWVHAVCVDRGRRTRRTLLHQRKLYEIVLGVKEVGVAGMGDEGDTRVVPWDR
jgi:hypothetical protein